MRGELIPVWAEVSSHIWEPLFSNEGIPSDIYCELYRQMSTALHEEPTLEQLADIVDSREQSKEAFLAIRPEDISSERSLVSFFEEAYGIIDDLAGERAAASYLQLLREFVDKFSLRYQLREPCVLCPTLPGIFSSLLRDLRAASEANEHLSTLFMEFDASLLDLRSGVSDGRIKTVIQKQINVLEALGASCNGVRSNQLGAICGELASWPHSALKNSLSSLYGFASDYPGIRHAGNPAGSLRPIDMRDLIAVSVVLAGFTPYLRDNFDPESVFLGRASEAR